MLFHLYIYIIHCGCMHCHGASITFYLAWIGYTYLLPRYPQREISVALPPNRRSDKPGVKIHYYNQEYIILL